MDTTPSNNFPSLILEGSPVGKRAGSVTSRSRLDQMVERGSILNARIKWIKVPEVTQSTEKGRCRVRDGLTNVVSALLLDVSLVNP
jgi:hypothetical protein